MNKRLYPKMNYSVSLFVYLVLLLIGSMAVISANGAKPASNIYKIAIVGDISGTSIRDSIREHNPDLVVALGDLGYESTLSTFKKDYGIFHLKCVVGNHDSAEDSEGDPIVKETLEYCGDWWNVKVGKTTMLFGFNTNGNLDNQLASSQQSILTGNQECIHNVPQTMLH